MVYPPWALLKFDFKKILCKIPTGIAVIFFETPTHIEYRQNKVEDSGLTEVSSA